MTKEALERANRIMKELEDLEEQKQLLRWIKEDYEADDKIASISNFRFKVNIRRELFPTIFKIIFDDINTRIEALNKELESL